MTEIQQLQKYDPTQGKDIDIFPKTKASAVEVSEGKTLDTEITDVANTANSVSEEAVRYTAQTDTTDAEKKQARDNIGVPSVVEITEEEFKANPDKYLNDTTVNYKITTEDGGVKFVVSVDNNVGTPSVTTTTEDGTVTLAFKNLKGAAGATGPAGPKGDSGVTAGEETLVNDVVTGGETSFLSAEVGKKGVFSYDCDEQEDLQSAINSVPETFQKGGLTILFYLPSSTEILSYFLTTSSWSTSTGDWENTSELPKKVQDLSRKVVDVYDGLDSDDPTKALSAKQGKKLYEMSTEYDVSAHNGGKAYTLAGTAQVVRLTITGAPTADGTITVTLGGITTAITITAATQNTAELVAAQVAAGTFTRYAASYTSGNAYVDFIASAVGEKAAPAVELGATGVTGSISVTTAGADSAIAAVPTEFQKGGLHIKFVDTASNKYNTYFLTTPTWSTSTADWQYSNENIEYAKNGTGVTVPKGKVVYINSSTGENPIFQLATNADYAIASRVWGVTIDSITNNAVGRIIHLGMIENIDTSAYTAGTELWLGTNGEYTNVRPTSPAFQTSIGMVIRQSATVGSIFVNIRYDKIGIVQTTGTDTDKVMSQKAVTELVSNLFILSNDADIEQMNANGSWIENIVYYTAE